MFDAETEAIGKCTQALSSLDDKAKVRVLQYLANRYDLVSHSTSAPAITGNHIQDVKPLATTASKLEETSLQADEDFPMLKDVVKRDLPKTDVDWVIVYCFYASNFGEDWFTREQVIAKYKESARWTTERAKNFSAYFNAIVKRVLIKSVNQEQYQMTDPGRLESRKILAGNSTSSKRGRTAGKKKDNKAKE